MNILENYFGQNSEIDAFLVSKPENIFYLTGFQGSFGYVLVLRSSSFAKASDDKGEIFLITDSRYSEVAQKISQKQNITFTLFDKNLGENLLKKIPRDFSNIAVENSMTLHQRDYWQNIFQKTEFVLTHEVIENIRAIKNTNELQKTRNACLILDQVFDDTDFFREIFIEGVTEKSAAFQLEQRLRDNGLYTLSFDIIVAFSENSALPHHVPSDRKLKMGDNILVDCGVKIDNYCSDMTRNFSLGMPSDEYVTYFNQLLSAQKETVKAFQVGQTLTNADKLCRNMLGDSAKLFTHSLGHGVGLEVHELPNFSPKESAVFTENQVITCEPGIYIPGKFGIRIEDQVLITLDGPEILTKTPKELIIL